MQHLLKIGSIFCFSLFLLISCNSIPISSQSVLRINQPQYMADLKLKRPDLLRADCKANLIAKPEYRDLILSGSSMSLLIQHHYSLEMQREDARWAAEYRKEKKQPSKPTGYRIASYYDPSDYFGYLVGVENIKENKNLLTHPFIDSRGIGFKVFFQLRDFQRDLRASDFQMFAEALSKSGFHGDLKVQVQPRNVRYKFNNIVVHSATKHDSFIAEQVGLRFFAGKLSAISRGVDVDIDPNGSKEAIDWSEFLCTRSFTDLASDVRDYVNYY